MDPNKLQALMKQGKKDGGKPFGGDGGGGGPKPPKKGPPGDGGGMGGGALGMLKNIQGQLAKAIATLEEHEHGEGEHDDHGHDEHEDGED
jgi:hypothetical protein